MGGCGIACLVVIGLLVLGGIGTGLLSSFIHPDIPKMFEPGCRVVSPTKAREISGPNAEPSTRPFPIDTRVLLESSPCWVSAYDGGRIVTVFEHKGHDARARYQLERETARSGRPPGYYGYFDTDVGDLGDEAFCTTDEDDGTGLLVRMGDRLLYVSIFRGRDDTGGWERYYDVEGLGTYERLCDAAQTAARAILG